jgi:hypothetical protein
MVSSEKDFHYTRSDGKIVMYTVSNVAMTWINAAKVNIFSFQKTTLPTQIIKSMIAEI